MKTKFFVVGFLCLWGSLAVAQNLRIRAYVDKTVIPVNQQFELSIELSGPDANQAPQPPRPNLDDFAAYVGSSSSQSIQFINGQMSVSKTFIHYFIATKEGNYRIPAVTLTFKGKTFKTNPINIQVIKSQSPPPAQTPRQKSQPQVSNNVDLSKLLYLKATVNKKQVYQNEPVLVSYRIYTAVNVTSYGISQLPNTVGFWTEEFPLPQRPVLQDEVINGRLFKVAEIRKVALFPQEPGLKKLDPLVVECEVQVKRRRHTRRDIFDSFFDDPFFDDPFFGFGRTVRQMLRSNPVSIKVLPLPEAGRPDDFSGAVGKFKISASVDKTTVKTNEAITLKVDISGEGNIKFLPKPSVNIPADFETYEPKVTEKINKNEGVISGTKSFEYVLIPRFAGTHTIKPVVFSYFDPVAKNYKSIATSPIDIHVTKGEESYLVSGMGTSKEDVKFIGKDIRFIQLKLPEFQRVGRIFYKSTIFYLIVFLPLLVLAGGYGYRRYLDKLSSNVAYARSKKANQMALKRLRKAKEAMREGNAKEFYGEVSKALMGFVGDKFNVPSAGLMTDEIETMLKSRGVKEDIVLEYVNCLKDCEYRRFAPTENDNGELKAFFERSKKAIINLEKEI